MSDSFDDQRAAIKADEERLRASLAEWNLDGPHAIISGGFAPIPHRYAICLTCGAAVMLNDLEQPVEGMWTERGVRLHVRWHAAHLSDTERAGGAE